MNTNVILRKKQVLVKSTEFIAESHISIQALFSRKLILGLSWHNNIDCLNTQILYQYFGHTFREVYAIIDPIAVGLDVLPFLLVSGIFCKHKK